PVAAAIAAGAALSEVGPAIEEMVRLDLPRPVITETEARGRVFRVDDYGNCVTDIPGEALARAFGLRHGDRVSVTIGGATFEAPFVRTYADVPEGERLVLVQSMGYVECAVNLGNLARDLGESARAQVVIRAVASEKGEAVPMAGQGEALIVFHRGGGIAGVMDRLTISAAGACELSRKMSRAFFGLEQEELREIIAILDAARLDTLPEASPAPRGADFFTYEVTYRGVTRRFVGGAIPETAAPALGRLNQLIDTRGKPPARVP
ncbi:MAG TPA: SAM-dependent chlorinase/fluorinase, partial [Candidatus Hydrogenedentes bacterium]|nr:SAM-dependent chlorinase/fluorinase [Candidatus Hydrogenedentota bacterium]